MVVKPASHCLQRVCTTGVAHQVLTRRTSHVEHCLPGQAPRTYQRSNVAIIRGWVTNSMPTNKAVPAYARSFIRALQYSTPSGLERYGRAGKSAPFLHNGFNYKGISSNTFWYSIHCRRTRSLWRCPPWQTSHAAAGVRRTNRITCSADYTMHAIGWSRHENIIHRGRPNKPIMGQLTVEAPGIMFRYFDNASSVTGSLSRPSTPHAGGPNSKQAANDGLPIEARRVLSLVFPLQQHSNAAVMLCAAQCSRWCVRPSWYTS